MKLGLPSISNYSTINMGDNKNNKQCHNDIDSSNYDSDNASQGKAGNLHKPRENLVNADEALEILLIGNDEYHQGLFNGYAQFHDCVIISANDFSDAKLKLADPGIKVIIIELKLLGQDRGRSIEYFLPKTDIQTFFLGEQWEINEVESSFVKQHTFIKPIDLHLLENDLKDIFDSTIDIERRKNDRRVTRNRRKPPSTQQPMPHHINKLIQNNDVNCIDYSIFHIDLVSLKVSMADRKLELTPKEFALFSLFLSNPCRMYSTRELIENVWTSNENATKSDLYQYIYRIRKKIELDAKYPRWLVTVPGFGYIFCKI